MTTLDESRTVAQTREPSEDDPARPEAQTWQLGILTDRAGHVHLGAVVAGSAGDLDIDQLVVLVTGKQLADLRRLAERCIDDARLRRQLVQLVDLAAA